MRVLALIGDRPFPPVAGPTIRFAHLWPRVARSPGVELKVLGLDMAPPDAPPPDFPGLDAEFFRFGPRGLGARVVGRFARSWHEYPFSPALARRVDELADSFRPDVIQADEFRLAAYLPALRARPSPALQGVTFHNVESDLFARLVGPAVPPPFRRLAARLQVRSLRRFEARVARAVGLRLTYSEPDRRRYAELYPDVAWLPTRNGTDIQGVAPAPPPQDPSVLLLARWAYAPNVQGLRWFLDEVRPHLDPALPVVVAGSGAGEKVRAWVADAGWPFHDTPLDLAPLYNAASAVAVPVLEGGGTRGKILEALAYERPVVTTTKGPEGLGLPPDHGVTIADDPRAFARALSEVASAPPDARLAPARRGRQAVAARFDWSVVASELLETWRSCTSP
jgi:glycosyltransferase involved in cell wall biosynthesis